MKSHQGLSEAEAGRSVPSLLSSSLSGTLAAWGGLRRGWHAPTAGKSSTKGSKYSADGTGAKTEADVMGFKDKICYLCTARFGLTLRRHHCKLCCNAVCTPCSPHLVDIDGSSSKGPGRICNQCYGKLDATGLLFNETPLQQRNRFQLAIAGVDCWPSLEDTEANTALVVTKVTPSNNGIEWTSKTHLIAISAKSYNPRKRISCIFECDIFNPVDSFFAVQIVLDIGSANPEILHECRLPFIYSAISRRECVQQQLLLRSASHNDVGGGSRGVVTVTTQLELIDMILFPPRSVDSLRIPFISSEYNRKLLNLTRDSVKMCDLFPPSSILHSKLFFGAALTDNQILLPADEELLEIVDFCSIPDPRNSAAVGVLLLSTHRLIFIEYPNYGWVADICKDHDAPPNMEDAESNQCDRKLTMNENAKVKVITRRDRLQQRALLETSERYRIKHQSSKGDAGLVLYIPIGDIITASIDRYIKKFYLGLLITTKDKLKYQFQCRNQAACAVDTLIRLRKMKSEILWRRKDDVFSFNVDPRRVYVKYTHPPSSSALSNDLGSSSTINIRSDDDEDEWTVLLRAEYDRLLEHPRLRRLYRVSSANDHFQICPTYPPYIIACASVNDRSLIAASKERSIGRLGAVTWVHPETGAALMRSSQPMVGYKLSACPNDSKLLLAARATASAFHEDVEIHSDSESNFAESEDVNLRLDSLKAMIEKEGKRNDIADWNKRGRIESEVDEFENQTSFVASLFQSIKRLFTSNSTDEPKPTKSKPREDSDDESSEADEGEHHEETMDPDGKEWLGQAEILGSSQFHRDRQAILIGIFRGFDSLHGLKLRNKQYISNRDHQLVKMDSVRSNLGPQRAASDSSSDVNASIKLRVIDARPLLNAKGNVLMGKGHEIVEHIGGDGKASVEFAGIENIHVVRNSYKMLRLACLSAAIEGEQSATFLIDIHNSKWILHLSSILFAALCAATDLCNGDPVLVHCSDGWDRTSQVCSLAQLLLEPYYRTMEGFRILIMKDFNWFGHRFYLRAGFTNRHEYSPIFLQFLDCVWQVWRQFPTEFEFNEAFLELLVFAYVSRYTSDFVFDNFKDHREMLRLFAQKLGKTDVHTSVWDHILHNRDAFKNELFGSAPQHDLDCQSISTPVFVSLTETARPGAPSFLRSTEAVATRTVRLLEPSSAITSLALWETVHMTRGIPFAVRRTGASLAVTRYLAREMSAKDARIRELESEIENLKAIKPF